MFLWLWRLSDPGCQRIVEGSLTRTRTHTGTGTHLSEAYPTQWPQHSHPAYKSSPSPPSQNAIVSALAYDACIKLKDKDARLQCQLDKVSVCVRVCVCVCVC
jgi:hypothetical protein